MKIQDIDLMYVPGQSITSQNQSGKKNYYHSERVEEGVAEYNGGGFKQEQRYAKLKILAINENKVEILIDVKSQILEAFDRKKLLNLF